MIAWVERRLPPVRLAGWAAAAFALLTALVAGRAAPLLDADRWVSRAARSTTLAHPLWRLAMSWITTTGSTTVIGPLTALGCLLLLAFGHWRRAVFVAVAMTVTVGVRLVVVAAIARPRPDGGLAAVSNYSFPSGHSTASAAAALILVLVGRPMLRRRSYRAALYIVAGLWAFAVGLSRVALVVHWPSDVLGAWLFVLFMVPGVGLLLRRVLGGDPT